MAECARKALKTPLESIFCPCRAIDRDDQLGRMTPEEVARFLRRSLSWVYKNSKALGGVKLGGSLLFPGKEDIYERLFGEMKGWRFDFTH